MHLFDQESLFQNLVLTSNRMESLANRIYFEPMGLSTTYCKILNLIVKAKPLTPTQILAETGGTKSNLSQRLDVLEARGLVKRSTQADSRDRRNITIEITPEGRQKFNEIASFLQKQSDFLEQRFSQAERDYLKTTLFKINEIIDEHLKITKK